MILKYIQMNSLYRNEGVVRLTARSLTLLDLNSTEKALLFADFYKNTPLKRNVLFHFFLIYFL